MAIEFKVPELGENIQSGDVVNILVREGTGDRGQSRGPSSWKPKRRSSNCPVPHAGKVTKIHVKKGDRVKVGQALLTLEAGQIAGVGSPSPQYQGPRPPPSDANNSTVQSQGPPKLQPNRRWPQQQPA